MNKEKVNLNTIVKQAIADIRPQFEKKSIKLLEDICAQPITINADSLRITQCIGNILGNALKFTPENGRVCICLRYEGGNAVIDIEDNGIGINLDMQVKIFEPFKQESDAFHSCHNKGLGLGLSIVKYIMTMHDGIVSVSSLGLEKGSMFTMRLPIL